jgi:hypothetical protein
MIAALVATNLVLGIVAILMLKPRRQNLCDGCDGLRTKHRRIIDRYDCKYKSILFTHSPLYCSNYKPRKAERSEGE